MFDYLIVRCLQSSVLRKVNCREHTTWLTWFNLALYVYITLY